MNVESALFWAFALCTVVSAALVVLGKSPITSAMSLVGTFFFLAGLYVLLWAHTIAVLQVLVYAGAIMVLFLFVIMLLSLTDPETSGGVTVPRVLGGASAVGLLAVLVSVLLKVQVPNDYWPQSAARVAQFGTLESVGRAVFTAYLLPFEAVSLLLLVAIVGAVVVAKSRI